MRGDGATGHCPQHGTGGTGTDDVGKALTQRVRAARAAAQGAAVGHDLHAICAAVDEREDALRLARHHGVEAPPAGADRSETERERG